MYFMTLLDGQKYLVDIGIFTSQVNSIRMLLVIKPEELGLGIFFGFSSEWKDC